MSKNNFYTRSFDFLKALILILLQKRRVRTKLIHAQTTMKAIVKLIPDLQIISYLVHKIRQILVVQNQLFKKRYLIKNLIQNIPIKRTRIKHLLAKKKMESKIASKISKKSPNQHGQ